MRTLCRWRPLRRVCLVVAVWLIAATGFAQVAYDAGVATATSSASSFTIAHTIGTCANCDLIVAIAVRAPTWTVSSVTWNTGQSLTQLCRALSDSNFSELWHVVAPATGTHNVVVTLSAAQIAVVDIASFSGVNQTSPVGTAVCDAYSVSGTTAHSHATTGQANGLIVDFFSLESGGGTITVNGGQTSRLGPTTADAEAGVLTTAAGGSSVTTGYSWVTDFYRWAHATVGLNPVPLRGLSLLGVGR